MSDEEFVPDSADGEDVEATIGAPGTFDGPPLPADTDFEALVAERTADLQRLQAEYVNYKRRVDRDRAVSRQLGTDAVLTDLLTVLDGIDGARQHGDLTGPTKMIADELVKVTAKHGLVAFGEPGDPFDPNIHEALMHVERPGFDVTSCAQVFQTGYKRGDKVLRPARVAVADPSEAEPEADTESVTD